MRDKEIEKLEKAIKPYCDKYNFDIDDGDDDQDLISLSCRENGDVGEEEWSQIDYDNGEKLLEELERDFPVVCDFDLCDEWVLIDVRWL